MSQARSARYRVKISATVDPDLLHAVDSFVREHPTYSRSCVIEDALRLWQAHELDRQMEEQFSAPLSPSEQEDRAQWRRIRSASAMNIFHPLLTR